ncbi:hypothetical protein BGI50_24670 [Burkholderia pseudomallei]|nr:hypothetical protein BGI50_24670 [Burkholderia pseudomallei]KIX69103.1 hypothetical protein SZ30_06490 [Burkholderia pseudomallei]OMO09545.1 hypothetical protein BGI48_24810 [Burkholderia pseudomallei]ONC25138.1 hypothetical protein AQ913_06290 [Burkholderia pseudomallei]
MAARPSRGLDDAGRRARMRRASRVARRGRRRATDMKDEPGCAPNRRAGAAPTSRMRTRSRTSA